MSEENKDIVLRFIDEIFIGRNFEASANYVAEDFVDHGALPGRPPGLEGFGAMRSSKRAISSFGWNIARRLQ